MPSQRTIRSGWEPLAGYKPDRVIAKSRKLSANVTFEPTSGRIVKINASNEWETGAATNGESYILLDSAGETYTGLDQNGGFVQQNPLDAGMLAAVSLNNPMSIATREYDTGVSYTRGQALTALTANTTASTGGVVSNKTTLGGATAVTTSNAPIIGYVTDGVVNIQGKGLRLVFETRQVAQA